MSRVVHLSEAASIGIHAMILIAQSDTLVKVTDIAKVTGASKNHLSKVMQRLVKDELIKSTRGPSGGFVMYKNLDEITLLDIYESIEGKLVNTGCPLNRKVCPFGKCITGGIMNKMTDDFIHYFKSQTLDKFINNKQ